MAYLLVLAVGLAAGTISGITGSSLMIGAFVAKRIVLRLSPEFYRLFLDALLLCSGLTLLWAASR